jgi:hypothetical protein
MISPGLIAEKVKDHYRERKLVGNGFRELGWFTIWSGRRYALQIACMKLSRDNGNTVGYMSAEGPDSAQLVAGMGGEELRGTKAH